MESIFHVIWLSAFSTFLLSPPFSLTRWMDDAEKNLFSERIIMKFI